VTRLAVLLMLAACGNDHAQIDAAARPADAAKTVDAPRPTDARAIDAVLIDARPPTVLTVDCATVAPAASVVTMNFAYVPMSVSIAVGQVVKFAMEPDHDVAPDPAAAMTDSGLNVDFGSTGCLQFTVAGTFGYRCLAHGFTGSVTVN
jgi:plastocyanin